MKKQLFIILMVATTFFTACNSSAEEKNDSKTSTVSEQTTPIAEVIEKGVGEYLSPIDTNLITNREEFLTVADKLYKEFCKLSEEKYAIYIKGCEEARAKFIKDVDDEISNIEKFHNSVYLEWLAAKETNYEEALDIENNSPEFAEWRKIKREGWAELQSKKAALWEPYIRFKHEGWSEYQKKKSEAYNAYQ